MKALSIKQPWAKWIAQDLKTLEIRSWQTKYRGQFLIVSSKKADQYLLKAFPKTIHPEKGIWHESRENDPLANDYYHLGKAISVVELTHIEPFKPEHEAAALCDYAPGLYAWHLKLIKRIEKPFEVKGQLNIYNVDFEL